MVPFENVVMGIPHPWEGGSDRYANNDVRDHPRDQHRIMVVLVVDEDHDYAED